MIITKKLKTLLIITIIIIFYFFTIKNNLLLATINSNSNSSIYNITETIYKNIFCTNNSCETIYPPTDKNLTGKKSKELFTFYGHDATCVNFENECNSYNCSGLNEFECSKEKKNKCGKYLNYQECINCTTINNLLCTEKINNCIYNKTIACKNKFKYGQSGSLQIANNFISNERRTYLIGFDTLGFHWFRTGKNDTNEKIMGFKKDTRDVYFNNNLIQSNENFDIHTNTTNNTSSKIIWNDNKTSSLINSGEYIKTENQKTLFHSSAGNMMELDASKPYHTKINNGLKINNVLNITDNLKWKGNTGNHKELHWTPVLGMSKNYPNPSKENKQVLFYCERNSESGSCP